MKELSVFIDESGDFGDYKLLSSYYIISMVFHDQSVDIQPQIRKLEENLSYISYHITALTLTVACPATGLCPHFAYGRLTIMTFLSEHGMNPESIFLAEDSKPTSTLPSRISTSSLMCGMRILPFCLLLSNM